MTIEEVLRGMQEKHGNNWSSWMLVRLLRFHTSGVLDGMNPDELQEYKLLYEWVLEMIEAGIAFKQSREG